MIAALPCVTAGEAFVVRRSLRGLAHASRRRRVFIASARLLPLYPRVARLLPLAAARMFRADIPPPTGIKPVWHMEAANATPGTRSPLHPFPATGRATPLAETPPVTDAPRRGGHEGLVKAQATMDTSARTIDYNSDRGMYRPKSLPATKPDPVAAVEAPIAGARPSTFKDWDYMRPHNGERVAARMRTSCLPAVCVCVCTVLAYP